MMTREFAYSEGLIHPSNHSEEISKWSQVLVVSKRSHLSASGEDWSWDVRVCVSLALRKTRKEEKEEE